MAPDGGGLLGVLVPERSRSVVVIADDGELAVALRGCVAREYALVRDVRPDEALAAMSACTPWPWMVAGAVDRLDAGAAAMLRRSPILTMWLGTPPDGLPAHARAFSRFRDLAAAVREALAARVAGMGLAVGHGVALPDGSVADAAALEALIAAYPAPLDLPLEAFRGAARLVRRRGVGWRPARGPGGGVALEAVAT